MSASVRRETQVCTARDCRVLRGRVPGARAIGSACSSVAPRDVDRDRQHARDARAGKQPATWLGISPSRFSAGRARRRQSRPLAGIEARANNAIRVDHARLTAHGKHCRVTAPDERED
jgi:hypothetical protein